MEGNHKLCSLYFIQKALLHRGLCEGFKDVLPTFIAPKSVKTFQNDTFPDCRLFIHLGQCETSAFLGSERMFYRRAFRESELGKLPFLPFIFCFLKYFSGT